MFFTYCLLVHICTSYYNFVGSLGMWSPAEETFLLRMWPQGRLIKKKFVRSLITGRRQRRWLRGVIDTALSVHVDDINIDSPSLPSLRRSRWAPKHKSFCVATHIHINISARFSSFCHAELWQRRFGLTQLQPM